MDIQTAIKTVIDGRDLTKQEMTAVMQQIMTGECTPAQIGGFLVGLRMKGESVDEITAAATVMRKLSTVVKVGNEFLVDTCGTAVTLPQAALIFLRRVQLLQRLQGRK